MIISSVFAAVELALYEGTILLEDICYITDLCSAPAVPTPPSTEGNLTTSIPPFGKNLKNSEQKISFQQKQELLQSKQKINDNNNNKNNDNNDQIEEESEQDEILSQKELLEEKLEKINDFNRQKQIELKQKANS